ncbi:MAG: hypothetical protein GXP48_02505 [Acidobacteria bacterium]|nr:hypothetical protein [Acidobacteriota bacterium]
MKVEGVSKVTWITDLLKDLVSLATTGMRCGCYEGGTSYTDSSTLSKIIFTIVLAFALVFVGRANAQQMPIDPHPGSSTCYACDTTQIPLWGVLAQCIHSAAASWAQCKVIAITPTVQTCAGSGACVPLWRPTVSFENLYLGRAIKPDHPDRAKRGRDHATLAARQYDQ